jgi:hypothetical protein
MDFPFADSSMPADFALPIAKHNPRPDWVITPIPKAVPNTHFIYTWTFVDDTNIFKISCSAPSEKDARKKIINSLSSRSYDYNSIGYHAPNMLYDSNRDKIVSFVRSSSPNIGDVNIFCVNTF